MPFARILTLIACFGFFAWVVFAAVFGFASYKAEERIRFECAQDKEFVSERLTYNCTFKKFN